MNIFIFTKQAKKRFLNCPKKAQERIVTKLKELKLHPDPETIFKRLHHLEPATHRLRIGPYRLILALKKTRQNQNEWWVLDVGDRKDIYR